MPTYDCWSLSDRGGNPDGNEDVCLLDAGAGVFVIADGVGGSPAGARASRIAADTFAERIRETPVAQRLEESCLRAAVAGAHAAVCRAGEADATLHGLASTLSAVVTAAGIAKVVHVGDSRIYRLHGPTLERLTRDHTLAAELEREGVPKVAPRFGRMLARAIGSGERVNADISETRLDPGDRLLLLTDGVSDALPDEALRGLVAGEHIENARTVCERIFHAVLEKRPADNATVGVVRVVA